MGLFDLFKSPPKPPEPAHAGHPASEWTQIASNTALPETQRLEAVRALVILAATHREVVRTLVELAVAPTIRPAPPGGDPIYRALQDGIVSLGDHALPALLPVLDSADVRRRIAAALTLARIGARAFPALVNALHSHDAGVRSAAITVFEYADDGIDQRLTVFSSFLADPEELVRMHVASGLARCGSEAVPILTQALAHRDARARQTAAEAVGELGWSAARPMLPRLMALLADVDEDVRYAAVQALGTLSAPQRDPQARAAVERAMYGDPSFMVRHAAKESLARAAGGIDNDDLDDDDLDDDDLDDDDLDDDDLDDDDLDDDDLDDDDLDDDDLDDDDLKR